MCKSPATVTKCNLIHERISTGITISNNVVVLTQYDGYMYVYRNVLDSWEWNTCLEQLEHQRQDGLYKSLQVLVAGDTMQNLQQHLPQVLI